MCTSYRTPYASNPLTVVSFGARSDAGRSSRCSALKAYPALPTFLNVFCIRTPSRRIASSSGCASVSGSSWGTGELPAAGMKCELEYTGKLESGKVFDTTKDSVTGSFEFKLGKGEVIKGCTSCPGGRAPCAQANEPRLRPRQGTSRWRR